MIEELLAAEPHPARVTVVSNDTRVQEAGRRRGAAVLTCQEFVDWLIDDHPGLGPPDSPEAEKPDARCHARRNGRLARRVLAPPTPKPR